MPVIMNVDCPTCGETYPRLLDAENEDAVVVARAELEAECPDHDDEPMEPDEYDGERLGADDWAEIEDIDAPDGPGESTMPDRD